MIAGSELRRAVVWAIVGLLYGFLLAFLSLGAGGSGHGTLLPLIASSAPLGMSYLVASSDAEREAALFVMLFAGPLLWMLLGWLVALPGRGAGFGATLLVLHYASAFAFLVTTGITPKGLSGKIPVFALAWASAYLFGQIGFWWRIALGAKTKPSADL
jgi:hypothetical protein